MKSIFSFFYPTIFLLSWTTLSLADGNVGVSILDDPDPSLIHISNYSNGFSFEDSWRNQLLDEGVFGTLHNPGIAEFVNVGINLSDSKTAENNHSNPVPEPATMLLVGTGLLAIASIGRKKLVKKKRS